MSKRKQSDTNTNVQTTTIIHNVWNSHSFLSPNAYSPAAIGLHACLVRCCEYEQFVKIFPQGFKMTFQINDFIHQLNDKEKSLSTKCQLDIERSAIINRLRNYLEKNRDMFQNILNQIHKYVCQSMNEDPSLSNPQSGNEFIQQCNQRNIAAIQLHQSHRKRRLQFFDDNDAKQSKNVINLQNWIHTHFQILTHNMKPQIPLRDHLILHLESLLNNSFFINQQPSPSIVTHSSGTQENVRVKFNCRILCLLDQSHHLITIDNIQPFVRCVAKLNQIEGSDITYEQKALEWRNCTIVTTRNNQKNFSYADLSEVILGQHCIKAEKQNLPAGKIHYSPLLYRIDFHINVTVRFPNDPTPYTHCVIVESAPIGIVANTSQGPDLFGKLFLEDFKQWRSLMTTTDLTIDEIVNSIERYFKHKTGIEPKEWVMPHIKQELIAACHNQVGSIENLCHNLLVKILAQIDYMTEHPLLIFFHDDGLFLGICNSDEVSEIVRTEYEVQQVSICAVRFGSMNRMSDVKNIGIRVDVAEKQSFPIVQHYKFDTNKLSHELGVYIIKTDLCVNSKFDKILTSVNAINGAYFPNTLERLTIFLELYDSEKLRSICPHETRYPSIWHSFYNKENNQPNDFALSSNSTTMMDVNTDNLPYNSWNSSINPIQQYPSSSQPQSSSTHSDTSQYSTTSPVVFVAIDSRNSTLTYDAIQQMVWQQYPDYFQLIQSAVILPLDIHQTSFPNSQ